MQNTPLVKPILVDYDLLAVACSIRFPYICAENPILTRIKTLHFSAIDSTAVGAICGLASAVGYTATNGCLRAVADCDPYWVSAVKSFPTVVVFLPWVITSACRGQRVIPPIRIMGLLVAGGMSAQLVGNVFFQWSLGIIGIALAVPLTIGAIIVAGAILGWIFLGERLTRQTAIAVAVLLAAIAALGVGAQAAHESVAMWSTAASHPVGWWTMTQGVAAAVLAGVAYSVLGVVIRYGVTGRASIAFTIVTVGLIGTLGLGTISVVRLGLPHLLATNSHDLTMMLVAGVLNALSFLAITKAFQLTTVVFVNAINATQAAMAAIVGIVLFREALTPELTVGILLTVLGLMLMRKR